MVAVDTWGVPLTSSTVCFFTDNDTLVTIINKQTSRQPNVMVLMRKLILSCLRYNIQFTARHVPGRDNTLADKLSRYQVDEFLKLAVGQSVPYHVSPAALETLYMC